MQGCFCRKRERCGFYLLAFDHQKTMIERNKLIQLLLEEIKYFFARQSSENDCDI